jgi:methionine synthase II (cobalamin-independent)
MIGLLTGPFTLTKSCVDMYYNDEKDLCFDLANILQKEAELLQEHVDLISIDEPFFSVSYPDYAKDIIKIVTKKVNCKKRLHVCGNVTNIIPNLLDMPVDILSHEFKAQPNLINDFKNYSVSKEICLGSVRSDKKRVEDTNEIKNHILKAIDVFDGKISQVSPDCGLRQIPRDYAFRKLKNLVKACDDIYGKKSPSN